MEIPTIFPESWTLLKRWWLHENAAFASSEPNESRMSAAFSGLICGKKCGNQLPPTPSHVLLALPLHHRDLTPQSSCRRPVAGPPSGSHTAAVQWQLGIHDEWNQLVWGSKSWQGITLQLGTKLDFGLLQYWVFGQIVHTYVFRACIFSSVLARTLFWTWSDVFFGIEFFSILATQHFVVAQSRDPLHWSWSWTSCAPPFESSKETKKSQELAGYTICSASDKTTWSGDLLVWLVLGKISAISKTNMLLTFADYGKISK